LTNALEYSSRKTNNKGSCNTIHQNQGAGQSKSFSKKNNPADNTRKDTMCTQASGSSIVPKIPRRTTTVTRKTNNNKKGDTSQVGEERVQVTTSGAQPS